MSSVQAESPAALPKKMRALYLVKYVKDFKQADLASCFEVREVDVPVPKSGEVLVKVEVTPMSPSNLSFLQGTYGNNADFPLPTLTGTEASGTVVASGGGVLAWLVKGKRVGIISSNNGSWAEYVVVPATACIALPDDISFEAGCSCFVNPLTAVAFVEIAQARKSKAIVHTAAASALGKMLVKHAKDNGVAVICVVRKQDQEDLLKSIGAQYIVNSSTEGWKTSLADLCTQLNATVAFDAVGGSLTGDILTAMPNNSEVFVYGGLSGQACSNISPTNLIFKGKKASGFWLVAYLKARGMFGAKSMVNKVAAGLKTTFGAVVRASFSLEDVVVALQDYNANMGNDRVVFKPTLAPKQQEATPSTTTTTEPATEAATTDETPAN